MKILIVSNLYPPYYLGGYEVHCAQVAEALQDSGHEVRVLTSTYGLPPSPLGNIQRRTEVVGPLRVHRWLHQYEFSPLPTRRPWTLFRARRELADARQFQVLLREFQPDVVNWWNMTGLTKTILPIPNRQGIPDVYAIDDNWLIDECGPEGQIAAHFWTVLREGQWGPAVLRPLLRYLGERWEERIAREGIPTTGLSHGSSHACFLSEFLQRFHEDAGISFASWEVVYGGVQVDRFYEPLRTQRDFSEPLRVLYSGQLTPTRGLHTVVEAFKHLAPELRAQATLTVVGGGGDGYLAEVAEQARSWGLEDRVAFLGKVPHDEIPNIYKNHDVLVFASTRAEGLGFVIVEAMLAGCAVLTTGSGGAMEIALAANQPRFPKGDALALSRLLARLVIDRAELHRIATMGQEVAVRQFSFARMMAEWSATLKSLHEKRPAYAAPGIDGKPNHALG